MKIPDAMDGCFMIKYALTYDKNSCAPTYTLKQNIIDCVSALEKRGLLTKLQKIGLYLLKFQLKN